VADRVVQMRSAARTHIPEGEGEGQGESEKSEPVLVAR